MRKQVRIAFAMSAALAVLSFLGAVSPSRAAENPYTTELKQLRHQMQELAVEARNYQLQKSYCLPPHAPMKQPDQMMIDAFKARATALNAKYTSLKTSYVAFKNSNTHDQGRDLVNDYDSTSDKFWDESIYNQTRKWMNTTVNGKAAALAAKRERNCAPTAPPKTAEIVGPPVDLTDPGVALPAVHVRDVQIPPVPARFCSEAEKQATLKQFWDVNWSFYMNYQDAREYAAAIGNAMRENRGNQAALAALLPNASAATSRHAKANEDVLNAYDRAKAMPIENCGETKKEVGALPGNNLGASVEVAGAVGEVTIPKKPYLSLEVGGNQVLGVVEHERTTSIAAMTMALAYDIEFMPNVDFAGVRRQVWRATLEYDGYDMSVRSDGGSITTTTEGVGVPGTGDPGAMFPAGIFIANPAFNDVSDIAYSHTSQYDALTLGLEHSSMLDCSTVTFGTGLSISRHETTDILGGRFAAYPIDFRYNTDIETRSVGLFVRGGAEVPLDFRDIVRRYAGEFSGFRVAGEIEGRVNFLDADGRDRLDLMGFVNDAQSVRIAKDDTTFGYKVGLSLKYRPPSAEALDLMIGVQYGENDVHALAERSGQTGEQTQGDFGTQKTYLATVGTRISF